MMSINDDNYKKLVKEKRIATVGLNCLAFGLLILIAGIAGLKYCVAIGICLLVVGGILFCSNESSKDLKSLQGNLVSEILNSKFIVNKYSRDGGFSVEELINAGFCSHKDELKPNDYIDAVYKGISFKYTDAICHHIEDVYDSEGHSEQDVVTFKGPVIKLTTNTCVNDAIFIKEKGAKLFRRNVVKTEDSNFNKRYTTYSELDEAYVVSVLNSKVIDALVQIDELAGNKNKLYVYFNDTDILIGLNNNKDLFEKTPGSINKARDIYVSDADFIVKVLEILISTGIYFQ